MSRNLIIAVVGDKSIHQNWSSLRYLRDFDLMIVYFGDEPNKYRKECQYYLQDKGHKWALTQKAVLSLGEKINQYDSIWCPDEDIKMGTHDINRLFRLFYDWGLNLAQPSLGKGSYWSFGITLQDEKYTLRYTNFVEIMAPIFSREAMLRLLPTFTESVSGWGLDWIWPKILNYRGVAIIDDVAMYHTRPVAQGDAYKDFEKRGVSPGEELDILTEKYGVEKNKFVVFGGIPSFR